MAMYNLSRFSILCKQKKHCDTGATLLFSYAWSPMSNDRNARRTNKHPMVTEAMTAIMEVDTEQMMRTRQDGQHRIEQDRTKQSNTND